MYVQVTFLLRFSSSWYIWHSSLSSVFRNLYFFSLYFYISVLPINFFGTFISYLSDRYSDFSNIILFLYLLLYYDSFIFPSICRSSLFFSSLTLEFYICKIIYIKFQIYTYTYIIYSLVVDLSINEYISTYFFTLIR